MGSPFHIAGRAMGLWEETLMSVGDDMALGTTLPAQKRQLDGHSGCRPSCTSHRRTSKIRHTETRALLENTPGTPGGSTYQSCRKACVANRQRPVFQRLKSARIVGLIRSRNRAKRTLTFKLSHDTTRSAELQHNSDSSAYANAADRESPVRLLPPSSPALFHFKFTLARSTSSDPGPLKWNNKGSSIIHMLDRQRANSRPCNYSCTHLLIGHRLFPRYLHLVQSAGQQTFESSSGSTLIVYLAYSGPLHTPG
jgi:hypothetical protein